MNDADQHGNLSPQANRAPGNTNTVADGLVQSHHPIQQEWAKQQVFPNGTYKFKSCAGGSAAEHLGLCPCPDLRYAAGIPQSIRLQYRCTD
ncbi:hypothetical protein [Burkholderia sp. FERM BP-3421]|uniref:hypothetical protein n=1 Tax=Burkholderia sp. FERM BP-3421 TaxID=1494466 RepID=UPI003FCC8B7B